LISMVELCSLLGIIQINAHYIYKELVKSSEESCTNYEIQEENKEESGLICYYVQFWCKGSTIAPCNISINAHHFY